MAPENSRPREGLFVSRLKGYSVPLMFGPTQDRSCVTPKGLAAPVGGQGAVNAANEVDGCAGLDWHEKSSSTDWGWVPVSAPQVLYDTSI